MSSVGKRRTDRHCTRCGKDVTNEAYIYWMFSTCQHCSLDADGRFRDTGTYRKWRYFPEWHMLYHPETPEYMKKHR